MSKQRLTYGNTGTAVCPCLLSTQRRTPPVPSLLCRNWHLPGSFLQRGSVCPCLHSVGIHLLSDPRRSLAGRRSMYIGISAVILSQDALQPVATQQIPSGEFVTGPVMGSTTECIALAVFPESVTISVSRQADAPGSIEHQLMRGQRTVGRWAPAQVTVLVIDFAQL